MGLSNKARLCDQSKIVHVHDADGAYDGTATVMDVDMQGFDGCHVFIVGAAVAFTGTNHVTGFKIVSNSDSDGGGTDTDIATAVDTEGLSSTAAAALTQADYGTAVNTTAGDQTMYLDVRADQMPQGDRYIAAVTTSTGTIPISIIYLRYNGDNHFKDMFNATRTAFQFDGAAV